MASQPTEPSYFHRANDAVADRARRIAPDKQWVFVCECGHCMDDIRLTVGEFDSLRAKGDPIVGPGETRHLSN